MREPQPRDFLTTEELSSRPCYPSSKTLHEWRSCGKGPPFIRQGGRVFYRLKDVIAWEEASIVYPKRAALG